MDGLQEGKMNILCFNVKYCFSFEARVFAPAMVLVSKKKCAFLTVMRP